MKAALYLDPRSRHQLTQTDVQIAKYSLRDWHKKLRKTSEEAGHTKDDSFELHWEAKRPCTATNASDIETNQLDLLFDKYERNTPSMGYKTNIMSFWESRKSDFPELYHLACVMNVVAPTQVSVERNFSILKHVQNNRRTSLSSKMLEDLLIINFNRGMVARINEKELKLI